jgi:hypothetical protein
MLDGLREEVETLLDALGGDIEVPARFFVRDRVLLPHRSHQMLQIVVHCKIRRNQ